MKKMLKTLAIAASGFLLLAGAASAAEGQKDAKAISYSFEGPFGTFDKGAAAARLQGLQGSLLELPFHAAGFVPQSERTRRTGLQRRTGQGVGRDLHGEGRAGQ